jgi:hypothetical protein
MGDTYMISNCSQNKNMKKNDPISITRHPVVQRFQKSGLENNPSWPSQYTKIMPSISPIQRAGGTSTPTPSTTSTTATVTPPSPSAFIKFLNERGELKEYDGIAVGSQIFVDEKDAKELFRNDNVSHLTAHATYNTYYNITSELSNTFKNHPDFIMSTFGAVTVIGAVPSNQYDDPTQMVKVGQYGLIRTFASTEYIPDRVNRGLPNAGDLIRDPTTKDKIYVPQADRAAQKQMITDGIKAMSGTYANAWGDGEDFIVSSEVVWEDEVNTAKSTNFLGFENQEYYNYQIEPGTGRASAGPNLNSECFSDPPIITGANWSKDREYNAHLFAGDDFNNSFVITHETFHLMGVEDAYEYVGSRDDMIKPRASQDLIPNETMMHSNSRPLITNVEMRMLFDARANNKWTKFEDYEDEFVIQTTDDYEQMTDPSTNTTDEINNMENGLRKTSDGRIAVSYGRQSGSVTDAQRVRRSSVTVNDDGNGTAKADKTSAVNGESIGLTASPKSNFEFDHWAINSGGIILSGARTDANNRFTIGLKNVTLGAYFRHKKYSVKVISSGPGVANANVVQAISGDPVVITAVPNTSYSFDKWQINSGGIKLLNPDTDANNSFNMNSSNVELEAKFK